MKRFRLAALTLAAALMLAAGAARSDASTREAHATRPVVAFSTLLDTPGADSPSGVAVTPEGNVFVAGTTSSLEFPVTPDAFQHDAVLDPHPISAHGFLAELGPDGSRVLYATYFGGSGHDEIRDLARGPDGRLYVCGVTTSTDLPLRGGVRRTPSPTDADAFVACFSADGRELLYSTYVGGSGNDEARAVAVDDAGRIAVAGVTSSTDLATTEGAFQRSAPPVTPISNGSVFVARIDSYAGGPSYLTYLGDPTSRRTNTNTFAEDVALDGAGRVYVCGSTGQRAFPVTPGALKPTGPAKGSTDDAFLSVLDPARSGAGSLVYSTYLGGADFDYATALALEPDGAVVVAGGTASPDFPTTPGAFQPRSASGADLIPDAFVVKLRLTAGGAELVSSTYLGGRSSDAMADLAVDASGRVVVVGTTGSRDFPLVNPIQTAENLYLTSAFVARFSAAGDALDYSTAFGGGDEDRATACALAANGDPVVALSCLSIGVPTTPGAYRRTPFPFDLVGPIAVLRVSERDGAACPVDAPDVSVLAASKNGDEVGAVVDFAGTACSGATVDFAPASGTYFAAGEHRATAFATTDDGIVSVRTLKVVVDVPYDACVANATHDLFRIVTDPTSPVYGAYAFYSAFDNTTYTGVADSAAEVPGKGLVFREPTSADNVVFRARFDPTSRAMKVGVKSPTPASFAGVAGSCGP